MKFASYGAECLVLLLKDRSIAMKTKTCGGKTRQGHPCKRSPAPGSKRCKLHEGQTPGGIALNDGRFTRNQKGQDFLFSVAKGEKGAGGNLTTHGASSLVQAYYSNNIDRRTSLGQMLSEWEQEYATHCGYDSPKDCPITIREKIRLAIGNRLFQMCYVPGRHQQDGL